MKVFAVFLTLLYTGCSDGGDSARRQAIEEARQRTGHQIVSGESATDQNPEAQTTGVDKASTDAAAPSPSQEDAAATGSTNGSGDSSIPVASGGGKTCEGFFATALSAEVEACAACHANPGFGRLLLTRGDDTANLAAFQTIGLGIVAAKVGNSADATHSRYSALSEPFTELEGLCSN